MTKNKKRKSALREIVQSNGVSMTRAALLNDRGRAVSVLDGILEHEKNLSWQLQPLPEFRHIVGDSIPIHLDSNVSQTLLWGSDVVRQKRGIPHYVIDGGSWSQHVRFLDGIRSQVDAMPEVRSEQIGWSNDSPERNVEEVFHRLKREQVRRNAALEEHGLDHFADMRIQSLKGSGQAKTNADYPYLYVFIYDWDLLIAGKPGSLEEKFRTLIADGKRVGIHFIVATTGRYTHVAAENKNSVLKNILILNATEGGFETAGMFLHTKWVKMTFPGVSLG